MMEKEKVLGVISEYEDIKREAKEIVIEHLTVTEGKLPINFDLEEVLVDEDDITLIYTTGCRGSYDREHYYCPTECLCNDNWKEELINTLAEKKKKEEEDKLEVQRQKELKKVEDEKATLLKLKEKYPEL
jgi:hypothetical protein